MFFLFEGTYKSRPQQAGYKKAEPLVLRFNTLYGCRSNDDRRKDAAKTKRG